MRKMALIWTGIMVLSGSLLAQQTGLGQLEQDVRSVVRSGATVMQFIFIAGYLLALILAFVITFTQARKAYMTAKQDDADPKTAVAVSVVGWGGASVLMLVALYAVINYLLQGQFGTLLTRFIGLGG